MAAEQLEEPQLWCVVIRGRPGRPWAAPSKELAETFCATENARQEAIDAATPPTDDHPAVRYEVKLWRRRPAEHKGWVDTDWLALTGRWSDS